MDRKKIEELIGLYREGLIYFIYRYVNNLDTAEDLAEDVFVELILHPERFKKASSEKTYLYTIGRNKAVDYIRHDKRRNDILGNTEWENTAFTDCIKCPEELLIQEENRSELMTAMDQLKDDYRVALHLVYMEGMSYDETGRIMKKSRKQVENLVYRGKQSLRQLLTDED